LLECQATDETTLASALLPDFVQYNIWQLESSMSPIKKLHTLLQAFNIAHGFIHQAQKIACNMASFEQYSLMGTKETALETLKPCIIALDFTVNNLNFNHLYHLFDAEFLYHAWLWQTQHTDKKWGKWLKRVLNIDANLIKLPGLIARLAEHPSALNQIAQSLEFSTIKKLVAQNNADLFTLITYRQDILSFITPVFLAQYFKKYFACSSADEAPYRTLPQWLALFTFYQHTHIDLAYIVHQNIIELLLKHAYLSSDLALLEMMDGFVDHEKCVQEKYETLCQSLTQDINNLLSTQEFDALVYAAIYDKWQDFISKTEILASISEISLCFLSTPESLYSKIADTLIQQAYNPFNLKNFVESLGITPVLHAQEITAYEGLLVHLLVHLDDLKILEQIQQILSTVSHIDFNALQSRGHTHLNARMLSLRLNNAINAQKWQLFDFLVNNISPRSIHASVISPVITNMITDPHISAILQIKFVKLLINLTEDPVKDKFIKHLFSIAAHHQTDIMHFFLQEHQHQLNTPFLSKLLKQLIHHEMFMSAQKIIDYLTEAKIKHVISSQIKRALDDNHQEKIIFLLQFKHLLTIKFIEKQFLHMVTTNHLDIIRIFCRELSSMLRAKIVKEAFVNIARSQQLEIFDLLKPYLCSKQYKEALQKAFIKAAQYGNTLIMSYIYNHHTIVNTHIYNQAFKAAVNAGILASVKYLDTLELAISRTTRCRALKVAEHKGFRDILCYLNDPSPQTYCRASARMFNPYLPQSAKKDSSTPTHHP
ncbi:MAG TPA: hypothetical protein DCG13_02495, partial [Legionellales bacterium]|nr:hypothetical protein [Legionellales bacterium]